MRLEKGKIPRPQRGEETIAAMLVLICTHAGLDSPSALIHASRWRGKPILESEIHWPPS
jgi:hypothetical protein